MSWQTIVLLCVIGVVIILAVTKYIHDRKKNKKCGGGCSGCPVSNCPSKNAIYGINKDEKDDTQQKE